MDDYMDNMDNAITNKKAVLEQLEETKARQVFTIAKQFTTILSLSYEVNQLQLKIINRGSRCGRRVKSNDVRKFLKDVYC